MYEVLSRELSQSWLTLTVGQLVINCTTFIQFIRDLCKGLASRKSSVNTPPVYADPDDGLLSGQPKLQATNCNFVVNPMLIRLGAIKI